MPLHRAVQDAAPRSFPRRQTLADGSRRGDPEPNDPAAPAAEAVRGRSVLGTRRDPSSHHNKIPSVTSPKANTVRPCGGDRSATRGSSETSSNKDPPQSNDTDRGEAWLRRPETHRHYAKETVRRINFRHQSGPVQPLPTAPHQGLVKGHHQQTALPMRNKRQGRPPTQTGLATKKGQFRLTDIERAGRRQQCPS